jgi:DNA topoisomerase-1
MAKSIVVVESPAKARTIERYLGKEYVVKACAGHLKDLPKKVLGVDVEDGFRPVYTLISGKERIVQDLKKIARKSEAIFLAADPDREGEAICQHLVEELRQSEEQPVYRVLFNEITEEAIKEAFVNAGSIDKNKVAAQQARRILDRLVGYKVSPLLWTRVRRGLSAGRVQSVALRMVVDREKEREAFVPEEYWNFSAAFLADSELEFVAKATKLDGKKFKVTGKAQAETLLQDLRNGSFLVSGVEKREKKNLPPVPFLTSTLQQEASRKLSFSVKKTMVVAQRLYEGIELGGDEGRIGLITYMRTDSTRVAGSALSEAREYITARYGGEYVPSKPRKHKTGKRSQDAHEAVRPTSVSREPGRLKDLLGSDERRLYELIWKRFVASQMSPALFDHTEIKIEAPRTQFSVVGDVLRFKGFLGVYEASKRSFQTGDAEVDQSLPDVADGDLLTLKELKHEQKFTQPPSRYSEATLIKSLVDREIGRPSTYSQILSVIQDREYVVKEERKFVPTETGTAVSELLVENFGELFDYDYTARLEKDLDDIEKGELNWVDALKRFYAGFSRELERAQEKMKNLKTEAVPAGYNCEKCEAPMVVKWGRFGRFVACSNYPDCKNTREIDKPEAASESDAQSVECDKCGSPMVNKKGRFGEFLACSGYPDCKNTRRIVTTSSGKEILEDVPLEDKCPNCDRNMVVKNGRFGEFVACSGYPDCKYIRQEKTGVTCPECSKGEIIQRKSGRGKVFYGCNAYPKCKYLLWQKPVPADCPECGLAFLLERMTKKDGLIRVCSDKKCSHKEVVQKTEQVVS